MKAFLYESKYYLRVIPSKFMMNSTMIYEITTRGDILAMEIESQKLTVIKGTAQVEHLELSFNPAQLQLQLPLI